MNHYIDIQHACDAKAPISNKILRKWASLALLPQHAQAELSLRMVKVQEIQYLNHTYRKKNYATNVLAFPSKHPHILKLNKNFLGDVIICPEVLAQESLKLQIPLNSHWAHIIIHGALHLQGYDHTNTKDSNIMQALEISMLADLGFDNPYEISNES